MDKVKIGPMTYEIKLVERLLGDNDVRLDGMISHDHQTIEIDSGLALAVQRQTLWHEIIHGILTQAGRCGEVQDGTVDAIAYGIFGVIKDNPEMGAQ